MKSSQNEKKIAVYYKISKGKPTENIASEDYVQMGG